MAKTVSLSLNIILLGLVGGLCIIIIVGLSSGLAGRKNNCIKQESTTRPTTAPGTTASGTTSTASPNTASTTASDTTASGTTSTASANTTSIDPTVTGIRTTPTITLGSTVTTVSLTPTNLTRLPMYQKPSNYKLLIKVFFDPNDEGNGESERFEGDVEITLRVSEPTNRILFHIDPSLKIQGLVELHEGTVQDQDVILTSSLQLQNQLYELKTASQLKVETDYTIKIKYQGDYGSSTNINAFYKSTYEEDDKTKKVVSTKFQPTDARRAFPCFDEPGFKSTYEITIEHPKNSIALSNWPQSGDSETIENSRLRTKFDKTDPMSSYLAAWTVLPKDFGFKTTKSDNNKEIRVYARKNAVNAGLIDFALDIAKRSLDYFENTYFNISEAVPPKIDLLAFPQFPSGAMEHWGLIGFRETSLLFSEKTNSVTNKQSVAYVIAHELAHFWFGNLVTCRWWDDLWLNEGMARFLQFKAINAIEPTWDVPNQFLTSYEIPVMFEDSFESTHPVSVEVNTPDQINSVFDAITYDKGSSLLRMLESTVGEDNFRDALRNFLNTNKFDVADADTFYQTLKMPSIMGPTTAKHYMENWLLQINYPVIDISLVDIDSGKRVNFKQERFVQKGDESLTATSPFGFNWYIYMKCKAGGASGSNEIEDFDVFFNTKQSTHDLKKKYSWVMCNKDFSGYYLNVYSQEITNELSNGLLSSDVFSIGDRAFLVHNSFALAFNGRSLYDLPATMASYYEIKEKNNVPWRVFTWHFDKIASLAEHRSQFFGLSNYARFMAGSVLNFLDIWSDSGSHTEKLLKLNILDFLCRMQDSKCLVNATQQFDKIGKDYFTNPSNTNLNPLPANIRSVSFRYHTQNSLSNSDYFDLFDLYKLTSDSQEKSLALSSLSYPRNIWFLNEVLESLLDSNSVIGAQDFFSIIVSISRNPTGRHYAWYFINAHWYDIVAKFGIGSRTFGNAVKSVCQTFDTPFLLLEMRGLFDYTLPGAGEAARKQALEQVKYNIVWSRDRLPDAASKFVGPLKTKETLRKK